MINQFVLKMLINKAKEASENSYSPYSNFRVGAAVLTEEGHVFIGTNVENAAYGSTICAERSAISNAISNGFNKFQAIVIYVPVNTAPPCGACRQYIIEFGKDIEVYFMNEGTMISEPISNLLPYQFKL